MGAMILLLAGVCLALETIEQSLYRVAAYRPRQRLYFLLAGASINVVMMSIWLIVLRHAPLSHVAPLMTGVNVTVPLVGWLIFKERVTARRWAGILMLTAGIAMVSTSFV